MSLKHSLLSLAALLAVLSAAPAAAAQYFPTPLTASQVLADAKNALGTRAPGTYVFVQRSRGSGMTRMITTRTNGKDSITTIHEGDFTRAYGTYSGKDWTQDEDGLVRINSNFHYREDPNEIALKHPDDPRNNVRVLGLTQAQPQQYVVEVNPPGGSDQFRYYNAKTFLLESVVTFAKDRHRHVTAYAEYRKMFGRNYSFRIHYSDGRPQNDTRTKMLSVARDTDTAPIIMPSSRPLYELPSSSPVTLPSRFTRDGIVIHATVGGRGLDLLLDSGASGLFIDPGVAHSLGLTSFGKSTDTIGGEIDMSHTRVPQMSIGNLRMQNAAFIVSPMSDQVDDIRIVGILGCDFIASSILGIDFKNQTVKLYPRSGFDPASRKLQTQPIQIDDCVPRTKASFERIDGSFLVDTGAFTTIAYRNYVNKLPSAPTVGGFQQFEAVGGNVEARIRTLKDFSFGGILFRSAGVLVPLGSTFDITDYDGIIGRDTLSQYHLFFDYAKRAIYTKPNS